MRCRDCGNRDFKMERKVGIRSDICDECWDNRLLVLEAVKTNKITMEQFQDYQRHKYSRKNKVLKWGISKPSPSFVGEPRKNDREHGGGE